MPVIVVFAAGGLVAGVLALAWPLLSRMMRFRKRRRIDDKMREMPYGAPRKDPR